MPFILFAVAAFQSTALCQDRSTPMRQDMIQKGFPNGLSWEVLSNAEEVTHLYGVEMGAGLLVSEVASRSGKRVSDQMQQTAQAMMTRGCLFGDVAQKVDALYKNRANVRIPIAYACRRSAMKEGGEDACGIRSSNQREYGLLELQIRWV